MSQQCLHHPSLSLSTVGYNKAKKMGKKKKREEGMEGRNSIFNAEALLEECVWFLQGAMYILKGKHTAIKLF